jgi:hypothetical protein
MVPFRALLPIETVRHFIVMVPFHALQSIETVALEYSRINTSLPAEVSLQSPAAPASGSP